MPRKIINSFAYAEALWQTDLTDWVKVLHNAGRFRDILPNQSLGFVLKED